MLPYATRYTPTASDAERLVAFAKLPSDHEQSCVNPSSNEQAHLRHDRNDFLGQAEIDSYGGVSPYLGGRLHFKQPNSRRGEGTKGIRVHGPQDHRSTCAC